MPAQSERLRLTGTQDPALSCREREQLRSRVDTRTHTISVLVSVPAGAVINSPVKTLLRGAVYSRHRATTPADQAAVRLTAEVTALREAATMLASMPTPQATTLFSPSPISHST